MLATGDSDHRLFLQEAVMKKSLVLIVMLLVLLTACAPGSDVEVTTPETRITLTTPSLNPELNQPNEDGVVAGLLLGLWHGVIAPVMLVGSFFNSALQIYEVHNNGVEYNLGYLIGVAVIFLLLGVLGGRRR
jgi:cytochrome c biogenesis protein CcdA